MVDLASCDWLLVRKNEGPEFVDPRGGDTETIYRKLSIKLKAPAGFHQVKIMASDIAGNALGIPGHLLEDFWRGNAAEVVLVSDGRP